MHVMTTYLCPRCEQRFFGGASPRYAKRCPICGGRLYAGGLPYRPADPPLPLAPPPVVEADPGSYPGGDGTYGSLHQFVRADLRRLHSRERDFGLQWRTEDPPAFFRAAWVEATGELYVVQTGEPAAGGGHIEVLGVAPGEEGIERVLDGWREAMTGRGSLRWLRGRATAWSLRSAPCAS